MAKFERKKRSEGSEESSDPVEAVAVASSDMEAKPLSDVEKKAEAIRASNLPEAQKEAYLRKIGALAPDSTAGKVPFNVFAKLRKVEKDRIAAMRVYPKASSVRLATLQEWDEIFKDF